MIPCLLADILHSFPVFGVQTVEVLDSHTLGTFSLIFKHEDLDEPIGTYRLNHLHIVYISFL